MDELIEVKLVGLILDPISKTPVIILKPYDDNKIIPIWIGTNEANAITMEMEKIEPPRPMTHDLIKHLLLHFDARVEKVVVTDIVDNTYLAELYIRNNLQTTAIDCRPSDAVAIALKNEAKVYITSRVYNNSIFSDFLNNILQDDERFNDWFDSLSSDDFGNVEQ